MIKPDGVERKLVGDIIHRFENKGFDIVAMKIETPTKELIERHYHQLVNEPYFPSLLEYMTSGPGMCFNCIVIFSYS